MRQIAPGRQTDAALAAAAASDPTGGGTEAVSCAAGGRMAIGIGSGTATAQTAGRRSRDLAGRVRRAAEGMLASLPWRIVLRDWTGDRYEAGGDTPHWCGQPLEVDLHDPAAGRALLARDAMALIEHFLAGRIDLAGNLYALSDLRLHARLDLPRWRAVLGWLSHRAFQTPRRARANVRSHYDIPQPALDRYLDRTYRAYSCAMFDEPERMVRNELVRAGRGREDDFDSLERAQWRKFQDAIDFVAPGAGEDLLDIGCGYAGQLRVALASHRFRRIVGWTHSANQVREGARLLADFDPAR
jgi:hypothetical protein